MKPMSLLKRILYYLLLCCLIAFFVFYIGKDVDADPLVYLLLAVSISHYIFGSIFLRETKCILQLTIPLITTLISFGLMWLMVKIHDFFTVWYVDWEFNLIIFLSNVLAWEITYQIVKRIKTREQTETNDGGEEIRD
jgi:hypothetical protein